MPKSSQITPATSTEILAPGQLSNRLETALQAHGKGISDDQVIASLVNAKNAQDTHAKAAILAGIVLLAKKLTLGPRKFNPWLSKVALSGNRDYQIAACLTEKSILQTAKIYLFLANRFLWKLEADRFAEEVVDAAPATVVKALDAEKLARLELLAPQEHDALMQALTQFVQGRSLRRLLADLREAEKDADEAEREDAKQANQPEASADEDAPTDGGPPADMRHAVQTDFLNALSDEIKKIDNYFQMPDAVTLTKDHWNKLADALEDRAKIARARAV